MTSLVSVNAVVDVVVSVVAHRVVVAALGLVVDSANDGVCVVVGDVMWLWLLLLL